MEYEQKNNSDYEYFRKEISDLKAKNKELESARNDLFNQGIYLLEDRVALLDALEETTKKINYYLDFMGIAYNRDAKKKDLAKLKIWQTLITKYRG